MTSNLMCNHKHSILTAYILILSSSPNLNTLFVLFVLCKGLQVKFFFISVVWQNIRISTKLQNAIKSGIWLEAAA